MEIPTIEEIVSPELFEKVKSYPGLCVLSLEIPDDAMKKLTPLIQKGDYHIKVDDRNAHIIGAIKIEGSNKWFLATIMGGIDN